MTKSKCTKENGCFVLDISQGLEVSLSDTKVVVYNKKK